MVVGTIPHPLLRHNHFAAIRWRGVIEDRVGTRGTDAAASVVAMDIARSRLSSTGRIVAQLYHRLEDHSFADGRLASLGHRATEPSVLFRQRMIGVRNDFGNLFSQRHPQRRLLAM